MSNFEFVGDPIDKIKVCLQDYSNDFMELGIMLSAQGIDGVRALLKRGHKVRTVKEYLKNYEDEGRETLSEENKINPLFLKKVAKLNKLARRVNSLSEEITELQVLEIIVKVKKIIYF